MGPESFIGAVGKFAGYYVPEGWVKCDGSKMEIRTNAALYSLLGNRFGGDGVKDFAVPNLPSNDGTIYCICVQGYYPPHP